MLRYKQAFKKMSNDNLKRFSTFFGRTTFFKNISLPFFTSSILFLFNSQTRLFFEENKQWSNKVIKLQKEEDLMSIIDSNQDIYWILDFYAE